MIIFWNSLKITLNDIEKNTAILIVLFSDTMLCYREFKKGVDALQAYWIA